MRERTNILHSGWNVPTVAVLSLILGFGSFVGCHSSLAQREEAVFQTSQRLFEKYLEGDAATAKQSLEQEIRILENPGIPLYVPRQAFVLFVECSRLYVLEKRLGEPVKADLALVKARYWNLKRTQGVGELHQ